MVTRFRSAPPSLRRRIEQALAAQPLGLGWRELHEDVARRSAAAGLAVPGRAEVVRQLGQLIVEGRVDDRHGRFVLLAVPSQAHLVHRHGRAA